MVAELDGAVARFTVVVPETDEGFLVDNVAVEPALQGSGVGRMLLLHPEAAARRAGHDSIYLVTHELMTENLTLYAGSATSSTTGAASTAPDWCSCANRSSNSPRSASTSSGASPSERRQTARTAAQHSDARCRAPTTPGTARTVTRPPADVRKDRSVGAVTADSWRARSMVGQTAGHAV